MTIGASIFLIAVGAILKYAVNATVSGIEIQTIGLILMIAGVVGLLIGRPAADPSRRARAALPEAPHVDAVRALARGVLGEREGVAARREGRVGVGRRPVLRVVGAHALGRVRRRVRI